jgi:lipopolysaccharide export system permease protein
MTKSKKPGTIVSVSRFDRYMMVQVLGSTLLGSLFAVVVLLGLQMLRLSELIIRFDLDFVSLAQMMGGMALSFTPMVFTIAFLFSILGIFGRMNSDRELIAAASLGLGSRRIVKPAVWAAVFVMLLSLVSAFNIGPYGNRRFEISIDELFKRQVTKTLRPGTFAEGFLGMILFVDRINPLTKDLEGVFIHDDTTFKDQVSISAESGRWIQDEANGFGVLALSNGILVSQLPEKGIIRRVVFDSYKINADLSVQAGSARNSPPSLGLSQLLKARASNKSHLENDPRPIWIEIARRVALAVACVLFVPFAYGLSLDSKRTAKSRAVFFGLTTLLLYWTLYFALVTWLLKTSPHSSLARSEIFNWIVIWIPNFVVATVAYVLIRSKTRNYKLKKFQTRAL